MNIDASKQSGQPDRDSSSLLNETLEQIPNVELLIGSLSCKQASWENIGPKHISGAMRQIVIDPTNRRRLYAVSANGGIWQLANIDKYPSTVWHPLTDGLRNSLTDLPASLHFRTMAVAPSNGQVLYAANAVKELRADSIRVYSEIYRSNTRGVSWRAIHQPKMGVVHRLVVHPAHPNIVFAATSTGLWRQDELFIGTWSNLFPKDCLDLALDPDDSSIMYLGVREQGIYKSFTSGSTWTNVPILDFDAAVAGSERQMIKISLGRYNSNATQQTPTTRTVVVRFGNEICVNQASGEGGAAAWQRATAASLDGGRTSRSDTNPPHNHEWYKCLAVDPFDPKHILIGASVLLESKNGGVSWSERALPHEDVHSLVFDQETPHLVYIANDGGLFSSIDGGTSWPSMRLSHTSPPSNVPSGSLTGSNGLPTDRGLNLAMGLITSEFVHAVVRAGRCVATIDHTGFILSEKFDNRWQFLFNSPDSSGRHGNHERGTIFTCPASLNRFYMFNLAPGDDPTNVSNRLAQFDFTHTDGFVNAPASPFNFLSPFRASFPVSDREENAVVYKPEHLVYNENFPGPFAARFSSTRKERLLLFGAAEPSRFTIQSLRLATDG
ncbi:MAG: hypothetical protein M3X11_26350, partial [Acidobacteriota bacterium]|nr:hypothetical protein [Acidobacteriota bacterium]